MRHLSVAIAKGIALGILVAGLMWGCLYLSALLFFDGPAVLGFWIPSIVFLASVVVGASFASRQAPSNRFIAGPIVGSVLATVAVVGLWLLPGVREGSVWSIIFPATTLGGIFGAISAAFLGKRNVAP